MRRFAIALFAVFAISASVQGHHIPVPSATTDADAFASAQAEYAAQRVPLFAAYELFLASTSAAEGLTALNDLEAAITTTIAHLGSLDVRPCFEAWHRAALLEFTTLAEDIKLMRSGGVPTFAEPQAYYDLVKMPQFIALMECEGGVTA